MIASAALTRNRVVIKARERVYTVGESETRICRAAVATQVARQRVEVQLCSVLHDDCEVRAASKRRERRPARACRRGGVAAQRYRAIAQDNSLAQVVNMAVQYARALEQRPRIVISGDADERRATHAAPQCTRAHALSAGGCGAMRTGAGNRYKWYAICRHLELRNAALHH